MLRVDASIDPGDAFTSVNDATMAHVHDTIRRSDAFVTVDGAIVVTSDASIAIDDAITKQTDASIVLDDSLTGQSDATTGIRDSFGRTTGASTADEDPFTGTAGASIPRAGASRAQTAPVRARRSGQSEMPGRPH
ncbi:MAG TPA: hypothetical protein VF765_02545 [Polyangiaceae bacterium]